MEFSYMKTQVLRPSKGKWLSTFLIALGVATAIFLPFMLKSQGYFTFYGDFDVQQIPFYRECHRAVKSGEIFWSWNTDLGANFIGSYTFYLLGSPFFWITLLFPNSFVPYLMGPLLILKFALSALTAYFYLRRFTRTANAAQLGGLLYAFSGFSVYNIFFNHFHEAIIFFPLLLLALEMLITENRRFVFALAVCLCAISNYFFFFGMVIFCVIYYTVRVLSRSVKFSISAFGALVFEAILGLMLSMILLLPSILAVTGNYRVSDYLLGWSAIMYGKEQIYANVLQCFFFPPDIPARPVFFPEAEVKWSSLGGWLPVFSTVGIFTWFHTRKKNWLGRVMGICIFMSMVPILNSAFYAFNSSYYARWFYMPILMMCLATVILLEDSTTNWGYGYKWVSGITLAVSLVIGFFPQRNEDGEIIYGLYTQSEDGVYGKRFLTTCLIAILSLALLAALLKLKKLSVNIFYKVAVPCVCIVSLIYSSVFIATGKEHSYSQEVIIDSLIEGEVDLGDKTQFRVDVYDGADNTSMYLGLSGINAFHSIVPSSIFEFYDFIGVERSVGSRPDTEQEALRPLLSVKYLLNRIDGDDFINPETMETKMSGYSYVKTESGYYIYENENYVPYGFSYDYCMSYELCEAYSETNRASLMLKAILLTDEQLEKYGYMYTDLEEAFALNQSKKKSDKQTVSTGVTYTDMVNDCQLLAKTAATEFSTDSKGFTATVTRQKETLVFFSVPYDEGWSATVNGEPCEIEKVNVGFMAVKVPEGDSTIRFDYLTPGLTSGIGISLVSAVVFLAYIIIYSCYSKKHKSVIEYPEGKELIRLWHRQEVAEIEATAVKAATADAEDTDPPLSENAPLDLPNNFTGGFVINPDIGDSTPPEDNED